MSNSLWYNRTYNLKNVPALLLTAGNVAHNYKGVESMNILTQKNSGVYAIINKINGKRYIGSSVDIAQRWRQHKYLLRKNKHHSKYLQNSWNKYGELSFDFVVIEYVDISRIVNAEQWYLDNTPHHYNTNTVANSLTGFRFSEEAKKLMSVIHTGFRHTEESKKKMSDIWSGKPRGNYSEDRKKKISEAHKGKKINENQKRGLSIGRHKPMSEETRQKISQAQKGYKPTEETILKLKEAWKRRKQRNSLLDNKE